MLTTILVAIPLMALLTLVQAAVLPWLPVGQVLPSFPFLFALAWSLLSSFEEGLAWAFVGGLFMDIFTVGPAGGLTLSYMAGIVGSSLIQDALPSNRIVVVMVTTVVATTIQQLIYLLFMWLFAVPVSADIVSFTRYLLMQALFMLPIYGALYLVKRTLRPRPVEV